VKLARNLAVVALIALAIVVLPGGGPALNVFTTMLYIAFFAALVVVAYRLYREHRWTLDALGDRRRLVLYGAIGLALLTFVATAELFEARGLGIIAWLALLGLCSYGVYWVYTSYRRYE
jgi:hypothetical protein